MHSPHTHKPHTTGINMYHKVVSITTKHDLSDYQPLFLITHPDVLPVLLFSNSVLIYLVHKFKC